MSPKNSLLKAGLTALGFCGLAAPSVADPGAPAPPGRPANQAPNAANSVLLLNDGRVLEGKLSENDRGVLVNIKGNVIPVKKRDVQGRFRSLREAYQFQAERLPERDPDEQMKLARWCLTNHFLAEAKTHLQAVLALSPKNAPANAMLDSLEAAEERAAVRDSGVARASAEVIDDRPGELSPGDLRKIKRLPGLGKPGLPQIFDLPPTAAVKRANEFAQSIHPVLQSYCAKCHNENHAGEFQLIEVRGRHERTPDVLRANLDATLRLVDSEDPAKSELLSSSLRPHGTGKLKRPIFLGSNDRGYQLLSAWVNSLRTVKANEPVVSAGHAAAAAEEEGFAVDRGGRAGMLAPNVPPPVRPNARPAPPSRPAPAQDGDFPIPFSLGGAAPKLKGAGTRPAPPALPHAPDNDLPELPPEEGPAAGPPQASDIPAPKKPRKPVKIDETLLERALMNRNRMR